MPDVPCRSWRLLLGPGSHRLKWHFRCTWIPPQSSALRRIDVGLLWKKQNFCFLEANGMAEQTGNFNKFGSIEPEGRFHMCHESTPMAKSASRINLSTVMVFVPRWRIDSCHRQICYSCFWRQLWNHWTSWTCLLPPIFCIKGRGRCQESLVLQIYRFIRDSVFTLPWPAWLTWKPLQG